MSHVSYYFAYLFQQYELKEAIKHQLLSRLPESSLEVISLDANKQDIKWKEDGREFYLHGKLYDVARIKNVNGKSLLYCINDKKEEALLKELSKIVKAGNDRAGNKDGRYTIKFQTYDFMLAIEKMAIPESTVSQKYFNFDLSAVSCIKEVNGPPPRQRLIYDLFLITPV